MKFSTVRWTTAVALAAAIALPVSAVAQTATEGSAPAQPQPAIDQQAAKWHLTAARDTLSQLTQLPSAAQLTGEARTQVSQLINNFNELITTQTVWQESLAKVQANLTALLGSASSESKPSGNFDPLLQARLLEFSNHLENFERVAAGRPAAETPIPAAPPTTPPAPSPPAIPPPAQPPATPTGPAGEGVPVDRLQALRHIQAVEAILTARPTSAVGTSGLPAATTALGGAPLLTLDRVQLDQLKGHLMELKRLMEKK